MCISSFRDLAGKPTHRATNFEADFTLCYLVDIVVRDTWYELKSKIHPLDLPDGRESESDKRMFFQKHDMVAIDLITVMEARI